MPVDPCIIISAHSDPSLNAEITFWANSVDLKVFSAPDLLGVLNHPKASLARAVIVQFFRQDDDAIDVLEKIGALGSAKLVLITDLRTKMLSSIRRLFEAKGLNVFVIPRSDFSTRLLADLVHMHSETTELDRDSLSTAIEQGWLVAHYQPKVPFQNGRGHFGVEALCRIHHPERGLLFPDTFIPLAEAHGLILELTDAVTVHAFRSLQLWDAEGMNLRLALNISPRLMSDTNWFSRFQQRCEEYEIDPSRITLEVTESSSQGGKVLALEILSRLRLKGFLLSIDDFGTGFSSMETLYKLPFGELKIDKGFVLDLLKSSEARAMVESTVLLAQKLGLKICAEGVETQEIFDALRDLQCDDAQGYYISKAIVAEKVVPFFREWATRQREKEAATTGRSKFGAVHALLGELLANGNEPDHTMVFSAVPPVQAGEFETAQAIASRVPSLVLGGNLIAALEHCQRAISHSRGDCNELQKKLQHLAREIADCLSVDGSLELATHQGTYRLLSGRSFIVGRQSSNSKADVMLPCQWLSRGEKNLRIFADGEEWFVEDLGSTNGHFIEGKRLEVRTPKHLERGATRIEVGKVGDGTAPAWLELDVKRSGLCLSWGLAGKGVMETVWALCAHELSIGRSAEATICVPECCAEFLADISVRQNCFWLAPRAGETISVSGVEFSQALPLATGCKLGVGNSQWVVRVPQSSIAAPLAASA